MGTSLQDVYDRFFSKMDEDFTGKEGNVYDFLLSAKARCYRNTRHSLDFILTTPEDYEGNFEDTLDDDEIEYMAYEMKRARYGKQQAYFLTKKSQIGTKDFNRLEDDRKQLDYVTATLKELDIEIRDFLQNFYYLGD